MKVSGFILVIFLLSVACSCKHVVKYDCTGVTPTYNQNIKPILDATCALSGCHGNGGDAFDLATYAGAADAAKKKSFMGSIQHKPFYQKMPKDAEMLTDTQIHLISCWIENGTPE
jgi:hypothetical protein